jgi:hypothetical protein
MRKKNDGKRREEFEWKRIGNKLSRGREQEIEVAVLHCPLHS